MAFSRVLGYLMATLCMIGVGFADNITAIPPQHSQPCMNACLELKDVFNTAAKSIVSGIGGTSNLTAAYWSAQQGVLVPACVITPTSASDVLAIVKKVEQWQCQFATKSGGHFPFVGASNIQGGILIDLSLIKEITLSQDNSSVVVGSGQRWFNVYSKLNPLGLSVLGTHAWDIGVGGSLLGGALSPMANEHGWGCDNVINFEVVIGDRILNVNYTSYPNLYFAVRGSGNNFGIVTRFTLNVYPQDGMWGGLINYDSSYSSVLADAMIDFIAVSDSDPKGSADLALFYGDNQWSVATILAYAAPVANPSIFANFSALPQTSNSTYLLSEAEISKNPPDPWGLQQSFWTTTYKPNNALLRKLVTQCRQGSDDFIARHRVAGLQIACIYVPVILTLMKNSAKNGGNVMGLNAEDGALMMFLLQLSWNDADDTRAVLNFAEAMTNQANSTAYSMGYGHPYIHFNHAHATQKPFVGYGPDNHAKLLAISKKYDPQQTFQKLQPGGFKL